MGGRRLAAAILALCVFAHISVAQTTPKINTRVSSSTAKASRCNSLEYRCRNGQCITGESLCDGLPDCRDGSDETLEVCDQPDSPACGPRTFRCDYGACVDGDAVCNGVKDCADNSDETHPRCKQNGSGGNGGGNHQQGGSGQSGRCRSDQFACDNGQCIGAGDVCDGAIDCSDRSDETFETCKDSLCPQYAFRCAYGGCIDNDLKCNGMVNCADGSDEDRLLCQKHQTPGQSERPPTSRPTQKPPGDRPTTTTTRRPPPSRPAGCRAPEQPENGQYAIEKSQCQQRGNCRVQPGDELGPGTQLVYKCDREYKLNGTADVFCGLQGTWSSTPECEEIRCPALSSASRQATCSGTNGWVSCDTAAKPRTTAEVVCRNGYIEDTTDLTRSRSVECNERGEWYPKPIKCFTACGEATVGSAEPLIVNGTRANVTEFPWHATLYKAKSNEKQFICGATIIRENLLVTAAHCIYDEVRKKVENPSSFYIAAGNVFRDYDYPYHDQRLVKQARVKDIYIVCTYLGLEGNYASDIAILEIDKAFVFSSILMPACIDPTSLTDKTALEPGNVGRVPGFGRTERGSSSFILQSLSVPYIGYNDCKDRGVATESERFITGDKFCAGYTNGSSVCDGDSGGGLVFKTDGRWYLRGIVSVGVGSKQEGATRVCDSYSYSLYTRVASHMEWVQQVILHTETKRPFRGCN